MNKKLLRKKLALMLANLKKKRKYYCETEWIQTDNINSYIDTGIGGANNNLKFEMRFSTTSTALYSAVFGNAREESENNWCIINGTGSNSYGYVNTIRNLGANLLTTWTKDGKPNDLVLWRENNNAYLTINGTTVHASASSGADNNSSILIGRAGPNRAATSARYYKFYYFKIYDNGVLVRDMIPVLDWDYVPCMYDKVTDQLFYNAGTGDLVAGREIHYVDYISTGDTISTSNPYIKTGIGANANTVWELDMSLNTDGNQLNGCTESSKRFDIGLASSGYFCMNIVDFVTTTIPFDTARHKFTLDVPNQSWKIDNNTGTCTGTKPNGREVYIGARNDNSFSQLYCHPAEKIYGSKIWDSGVLVRDYYPAIDENGVGYLFDKVTHTIFDKSGTNDFSYPVREVEYLESTGTQYIDTGMYPWNTGRWELDIQYTYLGMIEGYNQVNGVYANSNQRFDIGCQDSGNCWNLNMGAIKQVGTRDLDRHTFVLDKTNRTVYVDDTAYTGISVPTYTQQTNHSVWIGARYYYGGSSIYPCKEKIYGSKFYDNDGVLVRDFIPCYKDGVLGMWDKANGVMYQNAGTGDVFITGKIVESEYE